MRLYALTVFLITVLLVTGCAVPLSKINGDNPTGDVIIKCTPDDAQVYLDNIYVGKARRFSSAKRPLKVTVGAHVLKFELEGYMLEVKEVMTMEEHQTIELEMKLRPEPKEEE